MCVGWSCEFMITSVQGFAEFLQHELLTCLHMRRDLVNEHELHGQELKQQSSSLVY